MTTKQSYPMFDSSQVPGDLCPIATKMNPMLPGDWRSMKPVVDRAKCVKCAVCWLYCPVQCVVEKAAWFDFNLATCKGEEDAVREISPGDVKPAALERVVVEDFQELRAIGIFERLDEAGVRGEILHGEGEWLLAALQKGLYRAGPFVGALPDERAEEFRLIKPHHPDRTDEDRADDDQRQEDSRADRHDFVTICRGAA